MKKLLILLFVMSVFSTPVWAIDITTASGLQDAIQNYPTGNHRLMNDINASGYTWTTPTSTFSGTLDGQGYKIYNVNCTEVQSDRGLLFYIVSGTVKNVGIQGTWVHSRWKTGAFLYSLSGGTISDCWADVNQTFNLNGWGSGFVMYGSGTINRCWAKGTHSGVGSSGGGTYGFNYTNSIVFNNCFSVCVLDGPAANKYGFGVGGTTNTCYYTDSSGQRGVGTYDSGGASAFYSKTHNVYDTSPQSWAFGGIVWNDPSSALPQLNGGTQTAWTITNQTQLEELSTVLYGGNTFYIANDIALTGTWTRLGGGAGWGNVIDGQYHTISGMSISTNSNGHVGFVGDLRGTLKNLKVTGTIAYTGNDSSAGIGGLAGQLLGGVIQDCIVDVDITVTDPGCPGAVGGAVGYVVTNGTIKRTYSLGNLGGTGYAQSTSGGFVGNSANPGTNNIYNCYSTGDNTLTATNGKKGFGGWIISTNYGAIYYSGQPHTDSYATYVADPTSFYDITHNVYDTSTYPWDFTYSGPWSTRENTADYPPLKSAYTCSVSGQITGSDKPMKLVVDGTTVYSTTSSGTNFTFSDVAAVESHPCLIFIDDAGSEYANMIGTFLDTPGNISGLLLADDELILGDSEFQSALEADVIKAAWYNDSDVCYTGASVFTSRNGVLVNVPASSSVSLAAFDIADGLTVTGTLDVDTATVCGLGTSLTNSGSINVNSTIIGLIPPITIDTTGTWDGETDSRMQVGSGTGDITMTGGIDFPGEIRNTTSGGHDFIFENGETFKANNWVIGSKSIDQIFLKSDSVGDRFNIATNTDRDILVHAAIADSNVVAYSPSSFNMYGDRLTDRGANTDYKDGEPCWRFYSEKNHVGTIGVK